MGEPAAKLVNTRPGELWPICQHKFERFFGPMLKCCRCGAQTNVSMDGESKPIFFRTDATQESVS